MPEITKLPDKSRQAIRYFREMLFSDNPELVQSARFALVGYLLGLTDAGVLTSEETDRLIKDLKGV